MRIMLCLTFLLAGIVLSAEKITLVKDGKTSYTLILPAHASARVQLAAKELQLHWKKSTGGELKIGNGKEAKQIILKYDSALKKQESEIKVQNGQLILSGGDDWGILYAVYELLENQFGIRWISAYGDEKIPNNKNLTIDLKSYRAKPAFPSRAQTIVLGYYKHPASKIFFLRNRMDNGNALKDPAYPGSGSVFLHQGPQCHTLFYYISPRKNYPMPSAWKWDDNKEYFKTNPDFFAMDKTGKRVTARQLCFSNPALRKELTKRFLLHVNKKGKKGVFSLSAMDWPGRFCECPGCVKLEKRYQCPGGPLYDFLIELCKNIQKDYPDVLVSTLAYRKNQSEKPPVIEGKLPENMVIVFAPIDDDFSKPLSHKNNAETYQNLKNWSTIAKHLWVWYYPQPYGSGIFGSVERNAIDTKMFYEAGVTSPYYEHTARVHSGLNFADLLTYIHLRLFIDPYQDHKKIIKEFCDVYYGKAADLMIQYINDLDTIARNFPTAVPWTSGTLKGTATEANLVKWAKLFDQMEKLTADDPKALANVKDVRITLDTLTLSSQYPALRKKYPALFPAPEKVAKRIKATVEASMLRRYPVNISNARGVWRKKPLDALNHAMLLAVCTPKPIPAPLNTVAPEKLLQIYPTSAKWYKTVKDPDAAVGFAVYDAKKDLELPFTCGFYNEISKKFLLTRKIKKEEIKIDRYHLYKIGEAPISSSGCLVWTMSSWRVSIRCAQAYTPGDAPDKKYEIWISMKFEGPGYDPASKAKKNRVLIDRVIIVNR